MQGVKCPLPGNLYFLCQVAFDKNLAVVVPHHSGYSAVLVNKTRNTCIGCPGNRYPVFDGAKYVDGRQLIGRRRIAKLAFMGQVEHKFGTFVHE